MTRAAPFKSAGRSLVGALPLSAQRRVRAALGYAAPRPTVRATLETIDGELARATELFAVSEDAAWAFLDTVELAVPPGRPDDPFSDAYREWVWDAYRAISGRDSYSVVNESSPFDLPAAISKPYPFSTGSPLTVGKDLAARGHVLRCLGDGGGGAVRPPARVVEFGPGWGNLTADLVATGYAVTAVEVDSQFCELLQARCPDPANLTIAHTDMLAFEGGEPFDAAGHAAPVAPRGAGRRRRRVRLRAGAADALPVGAAPRRAVGLVLAHLRLAGARVRPGLLRRRAGPDRLAGHVPPGRAEARRGRRPGGPR